MLRPPRWAQPASGVAALALTLLSTLAGCEPPPAAAPTTPQPVERARAAITLLYTTDEHGWLLPTTEKGEVRGGAAEMLTRWIAGEGHCAGPPPGVAAEPPSPACKDPATLALSGGDNWTGPAISSYFLGLPMVDAMRRMGYAASAFGNHEFDFGREAFVQNRARGRYPYLAANVRVTDPRLGAFELPAYASFERRGIKIGVVGLATEHTLAAAMASRFEGIEFLDEEESLARAIPEAWRDGPDVLVVIAHECQDKIEPILARNPGWGLAFVGVGHCHKRSVTHVGRTPVVNPGWRLRSYARVQLDVDPSRPQRERLVTAAAEIVDVTRAEGAAGSQPDEPLVRAGAVWQQKLDEALGEQIGHSADGMERDSPELRRWVAQSWREQLGVDVAILNKDGIRQAVPPGPITKATVYSVLPFDNKLVICSIAGSDLIQDLRHDEAVFAGVSQGADGRFVFPGGRPLDEGRRYTVATIDFLYSGGDGFRFQAQDASPRWTGVDWRAPVIAWTRALATNPTAPLERRLR